MKIVVEYDDTTGVITGSNGFTAISVGMIGFEPEAQAITAPVLELIKQGVTVDEIVKLRNNDLI